MNHQIKVGQVWKQDISDNKFEVIAVDRSRKEYVLQNVDTLQYSIFYEFYLYESLSLISDPDEPWLPLPDGYRLVTEEERAKHQYPEDIKVMYTVPVDNKWDISKFDYGWDGDDYDEFLFAVPVDYKFEEKFEWKKLAVNHNVAKAIYQLQEEVDKLKKELHTDLSIGEVKI